MDHLGKPLSHASVLLLSPMDSTLILGAVSGESGHFQFDQVKQDSYLLAVSLVGHQKHVEKIGITRDSNVVLHPITLYELVDDLDEVIVAAQKPLYEKQIDRMVINVQESITAAGNSVLEVLQKSPGVVINRQNNSILLNGKSGVSVMINNKLSRIPMDAVVQMLNGLSAANVEKIELISNPPAKYDAEGTGGIIHLVMVENADFGTNGNIGLTAGMNGGETLGTNFNINHRSNRMTFFTDYSILYDHNKEMMKNELEFFQPDFTSQFHSKMNRSPFTTVQNFRAGIEFNVGEKTVIGSMLTLYQRQFKMKAISNIKRLFLNNWEFIWVIRGGLPGPLLMTWLLLCLFWIPILFFQGILP